MKIVSSIVVALVSLSVAHLATLGRAHAQTPCSNPPEFETIGGGVAGITGKPILVSNGEPVAGQAYSLRVTNAAVNTVGLLVFGPELAPTPFPDFGATVYPSLATGTLSHMVIGPTGESGSLLPIDPIPFEVCGLDLYLQALVVDTSLPTLAAFTDAVHLRVGSLQPPSSSGQIPPPPVPNPVPSITGATLVTVSGTAAQAANVKIEAPTSTQVVPVSGGVFSAVVTLQTNKLNTITLQSLSVDNVTSPIVTLGVTQDSQPPALYIDFPENRTVLTTTTTDVAGRVSDLLSGFLGLTVTVNGQLAVVDVGIGTNGTFVAQGVVLDTQASTPIVVVAQDQFGNSATKQISLTYTPATGDQMAVESGNGQRGAVNTELAAPIVLKMTKASGAPFANKVVKFEISKNNGTLSALSGGAKSTELQVYTDALGLATAWWTLGGSAGCGNNRVTVTSKDISGTVFFCASATAGPAAQINVGSGNNQRVELLGPAPLPLRAWVNDSCNGIAGIPVTFTVKQGNGKVNGQTSAIALTSTTGHAEVSFTVGSTPGNNVVEADFATSLFTPAAFTTVGVERDPLAPTTFRGLVLDNARQPIEGALCELEVGAFTGTVFSGTDGTFLIENILAVGAGHLHVAGATATAVGGIPIAPGTFPALGYMTTVIANVENSIGMPVLLPALDPANEVQFNNTQDVVLTCQGMAGLKMLVKAGSMTLPDGTVPSLSNPTTLSLNQVHHDDIPMPMPDGAAPPFSWTLQPGGAHFDPPIQITYPNMSGLPPGAVAYFLSFDHDTERFEIVSAGTVSEDGSVITTDPGSGLDKAGWGCNCPPYTATGKCCNNQPGSNGCGTDDNFPGTNTPIKDIVPDEWICILNGGSASFSNGVDGACDKHDHCWGTCHGGDPLGNLNCNLAFLNNLVDACEAAFGSGLFNPCYKACTYTAIIYFTAVNYAGAFGAYQSSQDAACKNCPPTDATNRSANGGISGPPGDSINDLLAQFGLPPITDNDGDLMDDAWEAANGLDPLDGSDGVLDPDIDGLVNISEYLLLGDPQNPDANFNGVLDGIDLNVAQPRSPKALDETWTLSINGQVIQVGPNGLFLISNVSAPDNYGPGGPGTAPDFKSDDYYRILGSGKIGAEDWYVFSDYFQITQGQTVAPGNLTFTPIAPIGPASLVVQVNPPSSGVLTTLGETATTSVTALLPDGSLQDVSGSLSWSTYNSSNLKVASVSKEGVVTATGDGIAYITAKNDGATAVTAIIVAVGDLLTRVEGFVQQSDGTPVSGAQISVPLISSMVTTDSTGFFSLQGVPSDLGPITVYATAQVSGETFVGSVSGLEPEAGGITDAGVIVVQNTVQWAVDASGSWHVGSNWNTGQVPTANDHVVIDRPLGTFTITVSQGSQFAKSLTCKENLTVSGGTLTVTTAAQIDGTTILSGGTTTAGSLTVNGPFTLSGGTIAGTIVNPGFGGNGITSSGSLSKLSACTLNATLNAANGSTVTVQNGIVLNGTVNLNSGGSTTALDFLGTQTLLGTGSVVFAGSSTNNFVRPTSGVLTIGPQFTIRGGHGTVGSPALGWINLGTIHADTASRTITLAGTAWKNQSQLKASSSGILSMTGTWANSGNLVVTSATVNLGGTFSLTDLGIFQNESGTVNLTGTLQNTGTTLALNGTTGTWNLNGGTIQGGTLSQSGGAVLSLAANGNNRLDGVLVQGDLVMSQASGIVRINNGLNVTGKVRLIGTNTSLAFEGSESISAQEIVFEGTSASNRYIEMQSPGTLTIPAGLLLHGGRGIIGGSLQFGQAMTLVNQGEIRAEVSANPITISAASFNSQGQLNAQGGGLLTINSTSFTNAGTMALQGGATHTISSATWSNTGSITEDAATLTLSGSWTNPGTLTANGGTVNLGGTFTTGQLATFVNNGGAVNVTGTMNNAGARLVLNGATGSWTLNGGSILGGTLDQQGGALLGFASNTGNRLDGVQVQGDLVMSQASGIVRINNGLNVTGMVRLIGASTSLAFEGSETVSAQEVVFEGTSASNRYIEMQAPGTLTIPAGLLLHGGRGIIGGSLQFGQAMTLVNQGEIRADVSANPITISAASFSNQGQLNAQGGGTVTLNSTSFTNSGAVSYQGGATHTISSANWSNSGSITEASATLSLSGSWTNPGSITANGGTINLGGTFTTGQLATFVNNGGVVNVTGTLNNAGATLVLNGATGSWTLNGGSILGGTLDQQGGALLGFASNTGNRLDGVQVQGDLVMSQASGIVRINNGLNVTGKVRLIGASTSLAFEGSETVSAQEVVFEGTSASNRYIEMQAPGTLTIPAGLLLHGGRGIIGGSLQFGQAMTLVNQGEIRADVSANPITISAASFSNQGQLNAQGGGTVTLNSTSFTNSGAVSYQGGATHTISSANWSNSGSITEASATLSLSGSWTNPGSITANGGTINLGGTFTTGQLATFVNNGGVVNVTGTLNNAGATLVLNGATGSWTLNGGSILGGTLDQQGGALLGFASNTGNRLDGVQVQGDLVMSQASGIVRINNGLNVTGKVRIIGTSTSLAFEGSETVSAQEVVFEGTSASNRYIEMQAPGTLTIPAGLLLHGGRGIIGGSLQFGQAMTLVNQGEIRADVSANPITISAASFSNQGQLNAQGGGTVTLNSTSFTNSGAVSYQGGATHTISSANWSNSGSITEASATLSLSGSWTNPGSITANGGTINLGGTFTTGQLATFVNNGGVVNVTGTLNNAGATLVLNGATGSWTLNGGSILGGTLDQQGGALLGFASNTGNRLDGVQVQGDLVMSQASGIVRINNGLNVTGMVRLIGASTSLAFEGSETVSAQEVVFEGTSASNRYIEMQAPGTLTIPAGLLLHGGRGIIGGSLQFGQAMTLVNQGEIRADVSANPITISAASFSNQGQLNAQGGGTVTLNSTSFTNSGAVSYQGGATHTISSANWSNSGSITEASATLSLSGSWTNPGSITANGGTINLGGTFTTGQLATFVNNGGVVNVTGTLNNAGATLVLNGATGSWTLNGGSILGGTLDQQGGALLGFASNTGNRLDGVQVQGDLVMSQASGIVRINNGLNVTGKVRIIGTNTSLAFEGSEPISVQEIVFEGASGSNRYIEMQSPGTLTIPAGLLVHGGRGTIGGSFQFGQAMTLVNQGEIRADVSGNTLTLAPSTWSNPGTLAAGPGVLSVNGNGSTSGLVTVVAPGSLSAGASSFTQTGSGQIELTGATLTANGGIQIQGGTLMGTGTLVGAVTNSGAISPGASAGALNVTGSYTQTGAGSLNVELGGTATSLFDRLVATGLISLDGTLNLSLIGAYVPTLGDSYAVANGSSLAGQFASVTGTAIGSGLALGVGYAAQSATVAVVPSP